MDYDFAVWPPMLTGLAIPLLMCTRLRPVVARVGIALLFPLLLSGCDDEPAQKPPPAVVQGLTACATTGVCKGEFVLATTFPLPYDDKQLLATCVCKDDGICRWCLVGLCTSECIP